MYYVLLVICVIGWGILCGVTVKNQPVSMILGAVGGYALATAFQHYGLI